MIRLILKKFKKVLTLLLIGVMVSSFGYNECYGDTHGKDDLVIAIDYGHYKGEPGKRSPYDPVFDYTKAEIEYNAGVGRLVEKKLKEKAPHVKVYLTNPNCDNKDRSKRAVEAKKHNADLIYSFHMNAVGNKSKWQDRVNGTCVVISKNAPIGVKKMSQEFIDNYSSGTGIKKVADNGILEVGKEVGLVDKGNELGVPTILLEMDFMDNYQSYRNFSDPTYIDMVAEVISDSIINNIESLNK